MTKLHSAALLLHPTCSSSPIQQPSLLLFRFALGLQNITYNRTRIHELSVKQRSRSLHITTTELDKAMGQLKLGKKPQTVKASISSQMIKNSSSVVLPVTWRNTTIMVIPRAVTCQLPPNFITPRRRHIHTNSVRTTIIPDTQTNTDSPRQHLTSTIKRSNHPSP